MHLTRTLLLPLAVVVAGLIVPAARGEEPAFDSLRAQRLRERLAQGHVSEVQAAVAEMAEAPHSRHGLLLWEATLRAIRRVEAADRELPRLEAERAAAAAELEKARDSTSTSQKRRLEERLGVWDRDLATQSATRQVEGQIEAVARAGFRQIVGRLLPDAADELAKLLLGKLEQEQAVAADLLTVEWLGAVASPRIMIPLMSLCRERGTAPDLLIATLVALGRRGDPAAAPAVAPALYDPDWRVQVEAIEALRRFHLVSAIPLLIARMESADGRVRDDLCAALRSLTGQKLYASASTWRAWWEGAGARFERPPAPVARDREALLASAAEVTEGGTQFFGLSSFSKRVVYVLDISGSMRQPANQGTDTTKTKLAVARARLLQAIATLPPDAWFDVIVYAGDVRVCFPRLEPADEPHRKAATAFADAPAGDGTNIHGALQAAFVLAEPRGRRAVGASPAVDTIFFLTDGQPTSGRVIAPELILREVADWNRLKRIRVHTIGIGADHDRKFLAELAAQNGGNYASR
ncbi:MAG: VWA domain-containing protein [Planctomycetes bacterium]|nr:VWA domain-containing protein [Planctomycetota bacterium]